jgi:hypothetical protein
MTGETACPNKIVGAREEIKMWYSASFSRNLAKQPQQIQTQHLTNPLLGVTLAQPG